MSPANEFQFKVKTVKWFGLLSAAVILLMIGLGFWYLDRIVQVSQAYQSNLDFKDVLSQQTLDTAVITLGLEHDGLGMRNKRGVSALYMRAYSQFLAIIAGTVLALLGAVFVLARVDSVATSNDLTWGNVRWLLTSASPGVIISITGTLLIASVVLVSGDAIRVFDAPIYINSTAASAPRSETPAFRKDMDDALAAIKAKRVEAVK